MGAKVLGSLFTFEGGGGGKGESKRKLRALSLKKCPEEKKVLDEENERGAPVTHILHRGQTAAARGGGKSLCTERQLPPRKQRRRRTRVIIRARPLSNACFLLLVYRYRDLPLATQSAVYVLAAACSGLWVR